MLGWRQLSNYQRSCGVFILAVFVIGGALAVVLADSVPGRLNTLGGICCGLAFILNPTSYLQPSKTLTFDGMLASCRALLLMGVGLFFIGAVWHWVT